MMLVSGAQGQQKRGSSKAAWCMPMSACAFVWSPPRRSATSRGVSEGDTELLERMARGDQTALGELYERHCRDILRINRALLRDESLAADATQDVFLEAWRRAHQFDPRRGTVRAWLVIRARSRALDRLRSKKTRAEVALTDTAHAQAGSIEQSPDLMHLPQAFDQVSEEERAVLVLGYFEGLSCREIGERLGIPVGTVKTRTRKALMKLRAFWGEEAS